MSDWWNRRLGTQPQQQAHTLPPVAPPGPWQPQPMPAPNGQQGGTPPVYVFDQQGNKVLNVGPWQGNRKDGWAGDAKHNCPNCGSADYFSRRSTLNGTTTVTRTDGTQVAAAPRCWSCGYVGGQLNYVAFGGGPTDDSDRGK